MQRPLKGHKEKRLQTELARMIQWEELLTSGWKSLNIKYYISPFLWTHYWWKTLVIIKTLGSVMNLKELYSRWAIVLTLLLKWKIAVQFQKLVYEMLYERDLQIHCIHLQKTCRKLFWTGSKRRRRWWRWLHTSKNTTSRVSTTKNRYQKDERYRVFF